MPFYLFNSLSESSRHEANTHSFNPQGYLHKYHYVIYSLWQGQIVVLFLRLERNDGNVADTGDCSFSFVIKSSILMRSPSFNIQSVKVNSDLSFLRRGTRPNKMLGDRLTVEAMLSSWRFCHTKGTRIQLQLDAVVEMWEQAKSKRVRVFFSSNKKECPVFVETGKQGKTFSTCDVYFMWTI